jgi:toxin FitB
MTLLDTNIISEMMKTNPSAKVISWLNQQEITQLFITTITIAEITYGLNALPDGQRRHALQTAFDKTIQVAFQHRTLAFDEPAAYLYGKLMAHRKSLGRSLSVLDGQTAAIAFAKNAVLATRNIRDFKECGLTLVDPFE